MTASASRQFDIVVFGATSFVGQIICAYMVRRHGTSSGLSWAIAGRSATKLSELNTVLGVDLPAVVVDASDSAALAQMAASTRLVVSTVGPYALYGSPLVAACVDAGTDYCDLTGEPQWMQAMIDAHHHAAVKSGARIIHTCGFDSIPSDLGVWFTQNEAMSRFGAPCSTIAMRVKSMRGGASGGTIASMMNVVEEASHNKELRKLLANPYALAPVGQREGVTQPNVMLPTRDSASGEWIAPFVMASVNTRVVLRTHALLGYPWGRSFVYSEAMLMGRGPVGASKAAGLSGGLGGFMGAVAVKPVRGLVSRFLPKPGEGPSPEKQLAGNFDLRFFGNTDAGQMIHTQVTGDRDPGYGSTAKMISEAALCLLTTPRTAAGTPGGFWTPASALGQPLIDALRAHAGITFGVL